MFNSEMFDVSSSDVFFEEMPDNIGFFNEELDTPSGANYSYRTQGQKVQYDRDSRTETRKFVSNQLAEIREANSKQTEWIKI